MGLAGVTIKLYKETNGTSGWQTGTSGDALVASTITTGNWSHSFGSLPGGVTYYAVEAVPSGYLQTGGGPNGSAGNAYDTLCTVAGQTYTGNNFDDIQTDTCAASNISFKLSGSGLGHDDRHQPRGNTLQGETVTATFTVPAGEQLTLVSGHAPGPAFDATTAYKQVIFDQATATYLSAGTNSLTVQIPNCYYQIDFVCGPAMMFGRELRSRLRQHLLFGPGSAQKRRRRHPGLLHARRQSRRLCHHRLLA